MDKQIEKALNASIYEYSEAADISTDTFKEQILQAFSAEVSYLEKVNLLDASFDDHTDFEELRESYFDLLLMNFFAVDIEKLEGDYLESPEWEKIENQTLNRGTELLNLLLYIRECADEEIEPSLDDYLKEFLLVDEDEFQDEHRIYEPMIENQALVDSNYAEITRITSGVDKQSEIADLFYAEMAFFNDPQPTESLFEEFVNNSQNKAFDAAIFALIIAFNQN